MIGCFYWHDYLSCCSNAPAIMESSSLSPWPPYWAVPWHPLMQSIYQDTLLMSPATARLLLSIMNTQGIVKGVPPFLPQRDPNICHHYHHVQQSWLARPKYRMCQPLCSPSYSPITSVDASTDYHYTGSLDQRSKDFTTVTRQLVDGM